MALLDDMKVALRVSADDFDAEIQGLIDAAKADMRRVGVSPDFVDSDSDPLVRMAVTCFCKSRFGFDNEDAPAFESSYRQCVADMMNSGIYNTSAWPAPTDDEEEEEEEEEE